MSIVSYPDLGLGLGLVPNLETCETLSLVSGMSVTIALCSQREQGGGQGYRAASTALCVRVCVI